MRQVGGQAIQLPGTGPIQVSPQGEVTQDNQAIGQLEIDSFSDANQLTKSAATYFENPDSLSMTPAVASNVQVTQGKLETSNSSPAESATRMISLFRHFEMLQMR